MVIYIAVEQSSAKKLILTAAHCILGAYEDSANVAR
jgi:hypothetical protein